jgi:alpha-glucosidase
MAFNGTRGMFWPCVWRTRCLPCNEMTNASRQGRNPSKSGTGAAWWKTAVIYQIYPRSFQDSTGDGVGDLPGITSRLEYLRHTLGVDAIWVSPFFPSPMADFGYDVSDYTDVDPMFGSLSDADRLIAACHDIRLKIIIDWVPNHSSDRHPWFVESRSSLDNPKRDWYVWRDPAPDGGPPNNWLGMFGGLAWEFDDATDQYYLHTFLKEQPELNWRNPELEAAMHDTLRFWLDRGVDGFRIDVAHFLMKDPEMRSNPLSDARRSDEKDRHHYDVQKHLFDKAHRDIHHTHARIRSVLNEYDDRYSVGEIHESDWNLWAAYYGEDLDQVHQPYNFSLLWSEWSASSFRDKIVGQEAALPDGAWPSHVLGNHDEPRLASRYGAMRARAAAVLLLTLRGTPTLYYGDEIQMTDGSVPGGEEQDPWGREYPDLNRDNCRTPMQWNVGPGMGFTTDTSTPWLPFADADTNVEAQIEDEDSSLSLYRALLALRRDTPPLASGDMTMIDPDNEHVLGYVRHLDTASIIVAINFTDRKQGFALPNEVRQMLSTHVHRAEPFQHIVLAPNEAVILS